LVQELSLETDYKAARKQFLNYTKEKAQAFNEIEVVDAEDYINSPNKQASSKNVVMPEIDSEKVSIEQGYILGPIKKVPSMYD